MRSTYRWEAPRPLSTLSKFKRTCARKSPPTRLPFRILTAGESSAINRNKQIHKAARKSRLLVKELIRKFAQASCLDICQKVVFCLPKELRNMVYQEIFAPWDNSIVTVSTETCDPECMKYESITMCVRAPQVLMPKNLYMYHTRDQGFCLPCPTHCFDAGFVGKQLLEELVEEWYSAITLDFSDAYSVLETFMESENLGVGLRPASLFKRINIKVMAEDLIAKGCCKGDGICENEHSKCERASSFLASMKLIANVKHKVHIQIEISPILEAYRLDVSSTAHARDAQYGELLNALQSLKDSGHNVELRTTAWPAELPTLRSFMPLPERWIEWVETCRIVSSDRTTTWKLGWYSHIIGRTSNTGQWWIQRRQLQWE